MSIKVGQTGRPLKISIRPSGGKRVGILLTVPQKGNRDEINALGKLLDWNKSLISSYYDRALHPICPAAKLKGAFF